MKPRDPPPAAAQRRRSFTLPGKLLFTANAETHVALMQCFPGCSQGPFFDTICHCLVFIFAELKCNDDDDDESSSCNSLCQFLYHCHCLLLSLYICVISLKCNGKVGLSVGVFVFMTS